MPEIRLLDSSVVNLIAAGEVVDRPASAVKEMVENAIDAGATQISVEIRRGGLGLIRVSDNGCGMSAENARRAFLKHATSKIRTEDDLNAIATLGFRGEALAAVSAVSKITLITKEAGQTTGTRFEVLEGKIESEEECGCPDGTTFTVQDLFFNTPARLKFMKSEPAEAGAVQAVMERLALSHPRIAFRFTSNGSERFFTPGRGDLVETVFSVFGKEFAEMSIIADNTVGDIRVHGLVGKPVYSKANRNRQIFFLNGRYVRSAVLTTGLENSYQNKMLIGRVPVCVLFVEMPPSTVDVNVHPGKLEVKFADENAVAYAVRKATEAALCGDNGIVEIKMEKPSVVQPPVSPVKATVTKLPKEEPVRPVKPLTPPIKSETIKEAQKAPVPPKAEVAKPKAVIIPPISEPPQKTVLSEKSGWTISAPKSKDTTPATIVFHDIIPTVQATPKTLAHIPMPTAKTQEPKIEPKHVIEKEAEQPVVCEEPMLFRSEEAFRIVGEAFNCYILVEKGEEILFIDKHALHERMNFERLRKSDIPSQTLLHPIVIHLGIQENRTLTEHADVLSRFGFILESFGDDLLIREIPSLIDAEHAEPLLQQFADALSLGRDDSLMDRFYYDLACKASIRSGSKTTRLELEGLVAEYFRRESELQYCPHGRPIVFSLSKKSVEKQFKRLK
ncbi:MAG: DNA mismatch repair endonuclease MutL [Clostridia bacterium]|nr:DNA mismatch repair endonuclease MutL [Clostridia bacterium]